MINSINESWIIFNSSIMELFEVYAVIPSCFYWWNFVIFLLAHIFRFSANRNLHYLEWIWLHKQSKSISGNFLSSKLFTSHNTVRSSLQIASWMNLSWLSKLECKHICRNAYLSSISKSIFCIESSSFYRESDLISILICIECRCQSSQRSMIIMPTAPIIFSVKLILKGEVMKHSSNVTLPVFNDIMKIVLRVSIDFGVGIGINLQGK